MSLAIDVDKIHSVLLADGWHGVRDDSFSLDSYEYVWGGQNDMLMHAGGNSGVCATGFQFTDDTGMLISGPLTAVLAVRHHNV